MPFLLPGRAAGLQLCLGNPFTFVFISQLDGTTCLCLQAGWNGLLGMHKLRTGLLSASAAGFPLFVLYFLLWILSNQVSSME